MDFKKLLSASFTYKGKKIPLVAVGGVAVVLVGILSLSGGSSSAQSSSHSYADTLAEQKARDAAAVIPGVDPDTIKAMDVSGVKLDMTFDEASKILDEKGFAKNPYADSFEGVDGKVELRTYKAIDGTSHVWSISYDENFDQPQDVQAWKDKIMKRYGDSPNYMQKAQLGYSTSYDGMLLAYSMEPMPESPDFCSVKDVAGCSAVRSLGGTYPMVRGLAAYIAPKGISILLMDRKLQDDADDQRKAAAAEKAKENTANSKVNF